MPIMTDPGVRPSRLLPAPPRRRQYRWRFRILAPRCWFVVATGLVVCLPSFSAPADPLARREHKWESRIEIQCFTR